MIGAVIFFFGLADLLLSWVGIDLYGSVLGIHLPDFIWNFSYWVAMGIGGLLWGSNRITDYFNGEDNQ